MRFIVSIVSFYLSFSFFLDITKQKTISDFMICLACVIVLFIIGYKTLFKKKKNISTQQISNNTQTPNNANSNENKNINLFTSQAEGNIRIFNDCIELVQKTKNIDTFFMRYELGLKTSTSLKQAVEANIISIPNLDIITDNFFKIVQNRKEEVLNQTINSENERINKLKTPKGRYSNWSNLLKRIEQYKEYYYGNSENIYLKHIQFIKNQILNNSQ